MRGVPDLDAFLGRQRWFTGKARTIARARVVDWSNERDGLVLTIVAVAYTNDSEERYFVPLRTAPGPGGAITDALADDDACRAILKTMLEGRTIAMQNGMIRTAVYGDAAEGSARLPIRRNAREQSNSCVMFGESFALKVLRRLEAGPHPELEISRFLSGGRFTHTPPLVAAMEYDAGGSDPTSLALVHRFVENDGTAWDHAAEDARQFLLREPSALPPADRIGWVQPAAILGRRTAELHAALADGDRSPAFAPEPFTADDASALAARMAHDAAGTLSRLEDRAGGLPDPVEPHVRRLLDSRNRLAERIRRAGIAPGGSMRTRVHGDFHLGQVLTSRGDFVIIDFEGEPTRSLDERRARQSPLKDVAGMLRSFSYAANVTMLSAVDEGRGRVEQLAGPARRWEESVSRAFLRAYRESIAAAGIVPVADAAFDRLLDAFMLEKVLYELDYELASRPQWIRIPLLSLLDLLDLDSTGAR